MDVLLRLIAAVFFGGVVWGIGVVTIKRRRPASVPWRRVLYSAASGVVMTAAGVFLNFMAQPETSEGVPAGVRLLASVALPAVWAANLLGRQALTDLVYFGAFALNVIGWSTLFYLLLRSLGRTSRSGASPKDY